MIRLGRVEATGGFLLLVAWLNYIDPSCLVPMAMLACAVHELGHYAAILACGESVKGIRLTVIGAEMVLEHPLGYWQEGLTALAGPGVNLLLALIFCCFEEGLLFAGLNLALALFNLAPVGRLDGGRAVYCTLALLSGPDLAGRVGGWLDGLCALGMAAAGLLLAGLRGNFTLLLAAVWLSAGIFRQNIYGRKRNRACQRGRKKVQ